MEKNKIESQYVFADTRPHYEMLDALRGVAALLVVWYHVFEGFAFAGGGAITTLNHGYLAVDFFFMLSGFVIAYAYDPRWRTTLNLKGFFVRRLVRLHPMVLLSAVIGAVTFSIQGGVQWNGTQVSTSALMLALLCTMFFIPAVPGSYAEVRGNGEMFPLNGPSWSLFFEYIGNIIYALVLRRLSNKVLTIVVVLLGAGLSLFAIADAASYTSIGVGWTLDGMNFGGGLLRMLFPFSMGMLLSRRFKPMKISGAFWKCTLMLVALMAVPYIPACAGVHLNGVYEMACVIIVFPLIVKMGASAGIGNSNKLYHFLGGISYPLYIIHYPVMYLFYAWLIDEKRYTLAETWHVVVPMCVALVVAAYLLLKYYDEPIRRYLSRKWVK